MTNGIEWMVWDEDVALLCPRLAEYKRLGWVVLGS